MSVQTDIAGTVCGSCGRAKQANQPLCNHCYYTLPQHARGFLYSTDSNQLANAYAAAIDWLAIHRNWKAEQNALR